MLKFTGKRCSFMKRPFNNNIYTYPLGFRLILHVLKPKVKTLLDSKQSSEIQEYLLLKFSAMLESV